MYGVFASLTWCCRHGWMLLSLPEHSWKLAAVDRLCQLRRYRTSQELALSLAMYQDGIARAKQLEAALAQDVTELQTGAGKRLAMETFQHTAQRLQRQLAAALDGDAAADESPPVAA